MVKAFSTHKSVKELTPQFLRSWSLKDTVAKTANLYAPDILRILRCALVSRMSLNDNRLRTANVKRSSFGQITPNPSTFADKVV
jgi:hypothetical protein